MTFPFAFTSARDDAAAGDEFELVRQLEADAARGVEAWRGRGGRALCDAAADAAQRLGAGLAPKDFVHSVARICVRRWREAPEQAARTPLVDFAPSHLDDLCLACACAARPPDEKAWEFFLDVFRVRLVGVAKSLRSDDPDAETDEFLAELWAPRRSGLSLLDTYEGRAPLGAWLVLVFRRRLLRLRARSTSAPLPLTGERAAELAADPLARAELLALLRGELARELARLPARDRDLIEARVLRAERGSRTATRHGVSASYVSRRYLEVLETLRRRLRPMWERIGEDLEGLR